MTGRRDPEQVDRMWVLAEVADDGSANISEVIDYDFGSRRRHGIFRVVPGLDPEAPITVEAEDAPDELAVAPETDGTEIRIGDPERRAVTGDHQYRIAYPLAGVVRGGGLDWEAVGTGWPVETATAEVHVVAPFTLDATRCFRGRVGSTTRCDIRQVEPGHLVATVDGLGRHHGVSIEARRGQDLASPPEAPVAGEKPSDAGPLDLPVVIVVAVVVALAAAAAVTLVLRRAGRDRVAAGGATAAAWDDGHDGALVEIRLDERGLERLATIDFSPPEQLSPAQGGIVLAEVVRPEHKVAWLVDAAAHGAISLAGGSAAPARRLELTSRDGWTSDQAAVLSVAFARRESIDLSRPDAHLARAWRLLDRRLERWRRRSGFWDAAAEKRRVVVTAGGTVAALAGAVAAFMVGLHHFSQSNRASLGLAVAAGLAVGAGLAALIGGRELRMRTSSGSAAWLRVESFRQFLAASEAHHAEEAARRGMLREYTAWAIAVGEIDRWARAVEASTIEATEATSLVFVATTLGASLELASGVAQRSGPGGSAGTGVHGAGSFGGGQVGGGAGGGGGGSW